MTADELTPAKRRQARAMLDVLAQTVEPLAQTLGAGCEVVLHDLTNLPTSVYAIGGDVTGRTVGSPATDLLLEHVHAGAETNLIGYSTELPGGRDGRSSTIIVRLPDGMPVAALCLNIDVTDLKQAHQLLGALLGSAAPADVPSVTPRTKEAFPRTVTDLTNHLVEESIAGIGVPVELMKKPHKVEVVHNLKRRGVFQVKDAVEAVAAALDVTRFTIYNYLNELDDQPLEGSA